MSRLDMIEGRPYLGMIELINGEALKRNAFGVGSNRAQTGIKNKGDESKSNQE